MMFYITSDYYTNEYKGKQPFNPEDLTGLIRRASEVVDILTFYKIKMQNIDLDKINPFIKQQLELATAKMVEYYVINGGHETFIEKSDLSSVGIGSFNYSEGGNSSGNGDSSLDVPSSVINTLMPTGLLYSGVSNGGG